MFPRRVWPALAVLAALLLACQGITSGTAPDIPTPVVGPVTQTPGALPQPQPWPDTPRPAGVTPQVVGTTPAPQGTPVTCPGQSFRLTVPQGLGLTLTCFQAQYYQFDNPNGLTIWRFAVDPADDFCEKGCVDIVPLAQARAVFGQWDFPPAGQNATITFQALKAPLAFNGGQGTRSLEIHGQALSMVNAEELRYIFRGADATNTYAVFVTFPITASIVPSGPDPAQNTNPNALQPFPADPYDPQAVQIYNDQMARQLSQLPASAFAPRLDLLDALVSSLQVGTP